jgi:hypothetical protein
MSEPSASLPYKVGCCSLSLLRSPLNENEAFVMLWTEMMDALSEVIIELPTRQEVETMVLWISKKKGNEKATKS